MPDITGDAVDRVCTIQAKNRGMPHDFVVHLYEAARKLTGGRPISTVAAERLIDTVGRGDVVLVLTGAGLKPILPEGESDGPPGAAALSRALHRGLGAVPIYVLERHHARPVIASSHSIGLMVKEFHEAKDYRLGCAIEYAPPQQEGVPAWVEEVFDRYDPKAVVCTERIGPGKNGVLHSATAMPLPDFDPTPGAVVDTAPLVEEANRRGCSRSGLATTATRSALVPCTTPWSI